MKPTHYFDKNDGRIKPVTRPPAQFVRPAKTPKKPKGKLTSTTIHHLDAGHLVRHHYGKDGGLRHGTFCADDGLCDHLEDRLRDRK
jgi:hypothetical protein